MNPTPWTKKERGLLAALIPQGKTYAEIGDILSRSRASVRAQARRMGLDHPLSTKPEPEVEPMPTVSRSVDDLLEHLSETYERKSVRSNSKLRGLNVSIPSGPFAILCFGDPHLGDPGCDIETVQEHIRIVKSVPHVYALNIGDFTNNWVGRLGRLYAHQTVTDDEEIKLARWMIEQIDWICLILGNHDKWSAVAQLICEQAKKPYMSHGGRINIKAGEDLFVIEARHQFPGRSQYAAEFGETKAHWRGLFADLIIGGHTHEGASASRKNAFSDVVAECVNLGAYKKYDEYADMLGYRSNSLGPAILAVFDPSIPQGNPGRVVSHWDIDRGLRELESLRKEYEES